MNGLEQRVFFDSAATTPSFSRQTETVNIDQMNCYDFTAYIMVCVCHCVCVCVLSERGRERKKHPNIL